MSRVSMASLLTDLRGESEDLQKVIGELATSDLVTPTPSEGWTIHDQLTHIAFFDEAATQAATDPMGFEKRATALLGLGPDFVDRVADDHRHLPGEDVLAWLRSARSELLGTFAAVTADSRMPWFGPSMSAASCVTARIMETWAHGQDIADAVGYVRTPTARLRHVAHLGVITRPFSFQLRGLPVPGDPVRVVLDSPDSDTWRWGDEDAVETVSGPALDFCLVVTQRRNIADTNLEVTGPGARKWMSVAQAFAGQPGPGRAPLGQTRGAGR